MRLRLEPVDSLDALRVEWTALAGRGHNVFSTWEFAEAWWRRFGDGHRLHVHACRQNRALVAVLPLYAWREHPFRVLRFIGARDGDELGPVYADADPEELAAALSNVGRLTNAQVLLAEHVPGDERWGSLLGGRCFRHEANPVLRFVTRDWDEYLASLSRNFRSMVRRAERKVDAAGGSFRLTDSVHLEGDLDALFRLHEARWGRRTQFLRHAGFHRDFARIAQEQGWLRLWILESEGHAVAAWHGYRFGGAESYYQAGRDPAWDRHAAGLAMLAHSIRAAMEDGMAEYRFLRGDEPYKFRFTDLDRGLESFAVARGRAASTALATTLAARRAGRQARHASDFLRRRIPRLLL